MAQGDFSDDEDVASPLPEPSPPIQESQDSTPSSAPTPAPLPLGRDQPAPSSHAPQASAMATTSTTIAATTNEQLSDDDLTPDGADVGAASMVKLDDILAMGSDSSDDDDEDILPTQAKSEFVSSGTGAAASSIPAAAVAERAAALSLPATSSCDRAGAGAPGAPIAPVAAAGPAKQDGTNVPDEDSFARDPFLWCLAHERSLLSCGAEELPAEHSSEASNIGAGFVMVEAKPSMEAKKLLPRELGLPTCTAAHSRFVAVGSLRGAVMLLEPMLQDKPPQVLQPAGDEVSAVTAAALSADGTSLLVGHKSGQLVLWDIAASRVVCVVKDVHACPVAAADEAA